MDDLHVLTFGFMRIAEQRGLGDTCQQGHPRIATTGSSTDPIEDDHRCVHHRDHARRDDIMGPRHAGPSDVHQQRVAGPDIVSVFATRDQQVALRPRQPGGATDYQELALDKVGLDRIRISGLSSSSQVNGCPPVTMGRELLSGWWGGGGELIPGWWDGGGN